MQNGERLLRVLRGMGVERIFASPGSDWAPLWEALARDYAPEEIPRFVSVRHEETAVTMAAGYHRACGKLPAVVLHTTVGSLHAAMCLRIALHERIPMVVLAGESIGFGEMPGTMVGRQWLRLLTDTGGPARLMEPCVKWSFGLNAPEHLCPTIQRACQVAMSGPQGPAFVSVPTEYLLLPEGGALPAPLAVPSLPAPDPAGLDELARVLSSAKKPLLITEEAGRDPADVARLVALAEALGAPVLEAWQPYYFNFPREHPLYGGIVLDAMAERARESDAVLLVDAVVPWHPPSAVSGTWIGAIGEDPLRSRLPYWGVKADVVVPGRLGAALDGLIQRVKGRARPAATPARETPAATPGRLDTRAVAQALNDLMPADAVFVNETITHRLDLLRMLTRLGPGRLFESSFGGLGVGTGTALGVKHARPEATVVLAIGDGAFHYNPVVGSLGAAQEHGLPILVVLFDNAGYLSQKGDVATYYPGGTAVQTGRFAGTSIRPRPEYAKLAEAYGGWGGKVESAEALRPALQKALSESRSRLALLHVVLPAVDGGH